MCHLISCEQWSTVCAAAAQEPAGRRPAEQSAFGYSGILLTLAGGEVSATLGNSTLANIFCYESETVGITLNLAQTGTPYSARSGVQPPGHDYVAFKNRNYVSPLVYASVLMVNLDPELQGSGKIVHCEI